MCSFSAPKAKEDDDTSGDDPFIRGAQGRPQKKAEDEAKHRSSMARTYRRHHQQKLTPGADKTSSPQHRQNESGELRAVSPSSSDGGAQKSFRDA